MKVFIIFFMLFFLLSCGDDKKETETLPQYEYYNCITNKDCKKKEYCYEIKLQYGEYEDGNKMARECLDNCDFKVVGNDEINFVYFLDDKGFCTKAYTRVKETK